MVSALDDLKKDLDNLGNNIRQNEKDVYEKLDSLAKDLYSKIDITNDRVSKQSTSLEVMIEKMSIFIDTFRNHDENEMRKYSDILLMFEKVENTIKQRDKDVKDSYVSKEEFSKLQKLTEENGEAIKEGWKLFYKVSGGITALILLGSVIAYVVSLVNQLHSLGVK